MRATQQRIPGLITRVIPGTLTGTPPAGDPSYDARGYFDVMSGTLAHIEMVNVKPERPQVGVDVVPAAVGVPCDIVVIDGKRFLYVHEVVPFDEACT